MIVIGIPTGQRTERAVKVAGQWKSLGVNVAVITWDNQTYKALVDIASVITKTENRQSFAINHNQIIKSVDFDAYICGADDLYPNVGIDLIEKVAKKYDGKVIWTDDGCGNYQPTHPIITRGWYEKHKNLFDENYNHNFVDTDFFFQTARDKELIKCPLIKFDHRHPTKTGKKKDEIYKIGDSSYKIDKLYFSKKWCLSCHSVPNIWLDNVEDIRDVA